jgi:hypothetical protein
MTCCVYLKDCVISILDTFGDGGEARQGYNFDYAANYAGITPELDFDATTTGHVVSFGEAKLTTKVKNINSLTGKNIINDGCGGSYVESASLLLKTDCWSDYNVNKFLGANTILDPSKIVNKNLPSGLYKKNFSITENSKITNLQIKNLQNNKILENGYDYLVFGNSFFLEKEINATSGLSVSYSVAGSKRIEPYATTGSKFISVAVSGQNLNDGKTMSFFFPKLKINFAEINADFLGGDENMSMPIYLDCLKGFFPQKMTAPAFFTLTLEA